MKDRAATMGTGFIQAPEFAEVIFCKTGNILKGQWVIFETKFISLIPD